MTKTTLVRLLIALLTLAYTFALVMSAAHLTQWYSLYSGGLDPPIALGLAVALELVAFLLSITSNALKGQISGWAFWGANGALLLVWFGNAYAMHRASGGEALWVTLVASTFVPITTLVVGKVLGDLFALNEQTAQPVQPVQVAVSSHGQPELEVGKTQTLEESKVEGRGELEGNLGKVLEFLREREGKATAREVAERLEVSVKTARRYLNRLADEGKAKWNGEGWELGR